MATVAPTVTIPAGAIQSATVPIPTSYVPSTTTVNLIATQEVTGGILLGVLLLGEIPSLATLVGIIVTLAGIILVLFEPA